MRVLTIVGTIIYAPQHGKSRIVMIQMDIISIRDDKVGIITTVQFQLSSMVNTPISLKEYPTSLPKIHPNFITTWLLSIWQFQTSMRWIIASLKVILKWVNYKNVHPQLIVWGPVIHIYICARTWAYGFCVRVCVTVNWATVTTRWWQIVCSATNHYQNQYCQLDT